MTFKELKYFRFYYKCEKQDHPNANIFSIWRKYQQVLKKRIKFEEVYAKKVWEALNIPESKLKYEALKKIPWGPTLGWANRERNPKIDNNDGNWIAPSGDTK